MPTRKDLIQQAKTWIVVPSGPSGSQRVGCNCLGLFVGIMRELGGFEDLVQEAEKHVGFKHPITPDDLLRRLSRTHHLKIVRPIILRPGNLVLFFTQDGPQHLTLVTEPNVVIHSSQIKRRVVEHLIPITWRPAAEFEIVGLDD